jgi:hypothetical protein
LELVKFPTADGLELDGAYSGASPSRASIIHVHGKCGNFYQNPFIHKMLCGFPLSDISFLSFNNRGHDCIAEGYVDGKLHYVGGSLESFSQLVLDIEAAVLYASSRLPGRPIFLQGHSNGCEKIIRYIQQKPACNASGVILLSAADSKLLHERYIAPRTIPQQLTTLRSTETIFRLLPREEYGVSSARGRYFIPCAEGSLLEIISGDAMDTIRFVEGWTPKTKLALPAFAYIGGADPLRVVSISTVQNSLQKLFRSLEPLILPEGDHHFRGSEDDVIAAISRWLHVIAAEDQPR